MPPTKKKTVVTKANHVPKGSYGHLANPKYLAGKDRIAKLTPQLLGLMLKRDGLTAAEVASTMGLSIGAFRDRLHGRTDLTLAELIGLRDVYGWELSALIDPTFSQEELIELVKAAYGFDATLILNAPRAGGTDTNYLYGRDCNIADTLRSVRASQAARPWGLSVLPSKGA